jgi:hypothetical protein
VQLLSSRDLFGMLVTSWLSDVSGCTDVVGDPLFTRPTLLVVSSVGVVCQQ